MARYVVAVLAHASQRFDDSLAGLVMLGFMVAIPVALPLFFGGAQ